MATNNINNVLIRASNTSGVTPSSLAQGTDDTESTAGAATEIAINRADGKLFYLNDSDAVTEFTSSVSGNTYGGSSFKIGRDADNLIDFSTDNDVTIRVAGADQFQLTNNNIGFGDAGSSNDTTLTFNSSGNDGVIAWDQSADKFQFSNGIQIATSESLNFRDGNSYIHSNAANDLRVVATDIDLRGSAKVIIDTPIVEILDDGAIMEWGAHGDVTLKHVHNTGLTLTHHGSTDDLPLVFKLKSEEDAIIADETIARIDFEAGDSDGTDAILPAASIAAVAEATFATGDNSTKLTFGLGESVSSVGRTCFTMNHDGDFHLNRDGRSIKFGDSGTPVSLTHVDNTSLTLQASNGLGITGDGSNIVLLKESGSGDFTIDANDDIRLDANGADVVYQDDGTEYARLSNSSSDFVISSSVSDKDIIFKGNDGGTTKTALTLDMSASGKAIFNDTIEVGDNVNLKSDGAVIGFGADGDVTLEHQHNTGLRLNGSMQLQFNDADSYIFQSSESFYIRGHNDMYFNIDTPNDSTARHFIWRANTSTELMRLGEDKLLELKGNMIVPDGGNIGSASDADAITILGSGNVEFSQDVAVDGNLTIDGNLDFAGAARHIGDTNTNFSFTGADTISIQTGGTERISVNDSGMAIGTGARVTEIENNDSLGTSDTKLCTQGNVKAYVDTNALSLSALSVGSEGTASGDGAIAYDNSSGEFTYTPPLHDSLSDFVSNEHINHANVTLTAGDGLTGGGTIAASRTFTVVGGDGITANANDVAITAAQTTITSVLNDSLKIGRADGQDSIDFGSDDTILFDIDNTERMRVDAAGVDITGALTISGATSLNGSAHLGDNDYIYFGADNDYSLGYVSGNYLAFAQSVNSSPFGIIFKADSGGDDAGDEWRMDLADGGVMSWGNDINSAHTYVTHFSCTPNSTVANSTFAMAGHATVGHDLTVSGDLAVTGSYGLASGDIPNNAADTSGNAATATKLAATKTINGTAFDGSANITLGNDSVTNAMMADDAIDTAQLADGAVNTARLASDAVTGAKIADDAINSEHYTDGSIDTAHIADDQVTYAKIQNVSATDRILGRDSSGAGVIEEITPANLRTMLNVADGATANTGDITGVTAGNGLTGGGSSGGVTLNVVGGTGITANSNDIALTDGLIADGSNITSVGTLGSLQVDNVGINGNTMTISGGGHDFTIDGAGNISVDAVNDILFKNAGTTSMTFKTDTTPEIDFVGNTKLFS